RPGAFWRAWITTASSPADFDRNRLPRTSRMLPSLPLPGTLRPWAGAFSFRPYVHNWTMAVTSSIATPIASLLIPPCPRTRWGQIWGNGTWKHNVPLLKSLSLLPSVTPWQDRPRSRASVKHSKASRPISKPNSRTGKETP
ncbi:MAG: hypothetical protein OXF23_06620, partial [Candidatus Dadabacteria bacterium]|nr:hypothetical protein [Candidatus Dadabacteria bacterium]